MDDLSIKQSLPIAVSPTNRDGQRREEPGQRQGGSQAGRKEAIQALLSEKGLESPDELQAALQLVTDAEGVTHVHIWDLATNELLLAVPASEFAEHALAQQLFEGLLVERSS